MPDQDRDGPPLPGEAQRADGRQRARRAARRRPPRRGDLATGLARRRGGAGGGHDRRLRQRPAPPADFAALAAYAVVFYSQRARLCLRPREPEPSQWLDFLDQLWPGDPESIATLQEIFGYCLTPDTRQQKAFLSGRPKRSGKGTIGRVLTRLIGERNCVAPTLAGLGTNFGLAPLIGKRLAIISDARLSGRADQHAIAERLLSITGEDALTIDRKYASAWTGQVGSRFLILSNELPRLADVSGALAGRFILLSLTESFYGREDPGLTDKLLSELPGILNWAIAGWARLCEVRPLQTADVSGRGHAATRGLVESDWRVRARMLRDRRGVQRERQRRFQRLGGMVHDPRARAHGHGAKLWARSACGRSRPEDGEATRRRRSRPRISGITARPPMTPGARWSADISIVPSLFSFFQLFFTRDIQ